MEKPSLAYAQDDLLVVHKPQKQEDGSCALEQSRSALSPGLIGREFSQTRDPDVNLSS